MQAAPALLAAYGFPGRLYPSCQAPVATCGPTRPAWPSHSAIADERNAAVVPCGGLRQRPALDRIDVELVRRHPKSPIGYSGITRCAVGPRRPVGPACVMPPSGPGACPVARPMCRPFSDGCGRLDRRHESCPGVWHPAPTATSEWRLAPAVACAAGWWRQPEPDRSCCGMARRGSCADRLDPVPPDVSESLHCVDGLVAAPWLGRPARCRAAGFLIGSFTEDDDPPPVLREAVGAAGQADDRRWLSGHGTPNRPLPLGPCGASRRRSRPV